MNKFDLAATHEVAAPNRKLPRPIAGQRDLPELAVDITVRDGGNWRSRSPAGGGHGLQLMRGMMDSVDVQTGPEGTVVRMRRRIGIEVAGERARTR